MFGMFHNQFGYKLGADRPSYEPSQKYDDNRDPNRPSLDYKLSTDRPSEAMCIQGLVVEFETKHAFIQLIF